MLVKSINFIKPVGFLSKLAISLNSRVIYHFAIFIVLSLFDPQPSLGRWAGTNLLASTADEETKVQRG